MCFSCICLFVLHVLVLVLVLSFFSSSWYRGLAAICDCATPWTFLLTFLKRLYYIFLRKLLRKYGAVSKMYLYFFQSSPDLYLPN